MTQKLRMGVIGCGAIAQIMHIPYLMEHEKFDLVSLCDAYDPVLQDVADRYRIEKRYTDPHDLLHNDNLDAVIICHAGSHKETLLAALDANLHVLCEKPLAWNLREVEEVVARVEKSDRIVQMAYHKRYDPAFAVAKQEIDSIDDAGFARITVLHPANELGFSPYRLRRGNGVIEEGHLDPGTWDRQRDGQLRAFAGGALASSVDETLKDRKDNPHLRLAYGILTISLIHQIYMMDGFFGMPEKILSANTWREGFSIHALLQFSGDLRCSIDWHFLSHLKDYREEYAVFGNHKRVMMQLPAPYFKNFPSPVIVQGGDGETSWEKHITVSHGEAFENELLAFYDCVTTGQQPRTTVQDALKHSRFVQDMIDVMQV